MSLFFDEAFCRYIIFENVSKNVWAKRCNYTMEHDLPWVTLLPHECEATSGVRKALPTDRAPLLLLYDGYNMNDFVE